VKTILATILATALSLFSAETPDQLRDKGFEALKASQADETKTVEAARFLAQAAEAYEKDGNDSAAAELNSYLYWCKKKMTIKQVDAFISSGNGVAKAAVAKMEAVEKREVKAEDAAIWLARADGFAEASKDPFLSAVRYFEVADRFIGSKESMDAQRKSLDLMGKAAPVKEAPRSPASGVTYLASIQPLSKVVINDWFSIGVLNFPQCEGKPMTIGGRRSLNSILIHAPETPGAISSAKWNLNSGYVTLSSGVALEDYVVGKATSTFVFRVLGDGKVLWTSRPIGNRVNDRCDVSVRGIKMLELQVLTLKDHLWAWTIWVDPVLK
jgi:hypothetical protein